MSDTTTRDVAVRSLSEVLKAAETTKLNGDATAVRPMPPLGEAAQMLYDNATMNVDRIFEEGFKQIEKIEELCKFAKQALTNKKNVVNGAMGEYVATLETVQKSTDIMDKALSEIIAHTDQL